MANPDKDTAMEEALTIARQCEWMATLMNDWGNENEMIRATCKIISQKLIIKAARNYCDYIYAHVRPLPPDIVCDIVSRVVHITVNHEHISCIFKPDYPFTIDDFPHILNTLQWSYLPLKKSKFIKFFYDRFGENIIPLLCTRENFDFLKVFVDESTKKQFKEVCHYVFSQNVPQQHFPHLALLVIQHKKTLTDLIVIGKLLNSESFNNSATLEQFVSLCTPEVRGELMNFCLSHSKVNKERSQSFITATLTSRCDINITRINFQNVFKYNIPMLLSDFTLLHLMFNAGLSLDLELCRNVIHMVLKNGLSNQHLSIICVLIERGADIESLANVYTQKGGTPLNGVTELALTTGNIEIFKLVCSKLDNNVNKSDVFKSTPLHVVMKHTTCNDVAVELCRILCEEMKIDTSLKDCKGKTAAEYCHDLNDPRMIILKKYLPKPLFDAKPSDHSSMKSKVMSMPKKQPLADEKLEEVKQPLKKKGKKKSKKKSSSNESEITLAIQSTDSARLPSDIELKKERDLKTLLDLVLKEDTAYFAHKKSRFKSSQQQDTKVSPEIENVGIDEPLRIKNEPVKSDTEERKYDVYYSPRVKKFFETGEKELITRTIQTIERLARGDSNYVLVRKMNKKAYNGKLGHCSVYHSNIDSAKRILWHKKLTYSPDKRRNCKVLVILDVVLDHDKLNKAVRNAENWIKQGREEGGMYKVKRIAEGCYELFDGTISQEEQDVIKEVPFMMKDEYGAVQIYSIPEFVLSRVVNMPEGELRRFGLPLKLSQEEHSVVDMNFEEKSIIGLSYHKKTLLVVGRSGTGKTTCCLQRLWEEFLHYWRLVNENKDPIIPRLQNFEITQQSLEVEPGISSADICFIKLTESHEAEDIRTSFNENMSLEKPTTQSDTEDQEEQSITNDCDHLHQVFVTKSSYLCHEVKRRFYDLVSSHSWLWEQFHTFENLPLPSSLHDMEIPFPLFVTSRNLLILLDGSLAEGESFFRRKNGKLIDSVRNSEQLYLDKVITDILENDEEEDDDSDSEKDEYEDNEADLEDFQQKTPDRQLIEITASYFKNHIWKEIAHGNAKEIDPILVWQEIKSFIKGSVQALRSSHGFLSVEEYITVGKNKAPNFHDSRKDIYSLFEKYQQFCKSPRDKGVKYFDECDLLFHIYCHRSSLPWLFHNFYIDEVQDFTEAELYLLLSCSQCPNGNFLCGDSAQSIMRGVSFRFTDVRSLFHELAQSFQCKVSVPDRPHYLTVNYRAHAGILRVADSVIELLGRFFQDSFDAIPESNQSQFKSEATSLSQKPLLLYYDDPNELPHLLAGNQASREIEFGAHQAIIIPSKDTKLPESLENAIVLTVLEAKGLEFNDVLLYNFFSESIVDDKSWELVSAYTSIEIEKSQDKITQKYKRVLESFDESKHKTLNTELKCLYTALTRAKRNLWICDRGSSSANEMHPMYDYFLKKCIVKEFKLEESGTGFSSDLSTQTPEEWKKAGDYLFSKQLWTQARKCYVRAKADSSVFQVDAYVEAQQKNYQKAAVYFLESDRIDHERRLLIKAAMCLRAVKCNTEEKSWYYSTLAFFCQKLGKVKWAGELYLYIKDFDKFIWASETKERYCRVVRRLLNCGEKLRALRKAVEYGDKAKLKNITIGKLAYDCVKTYMRKGDRNAVLESIEHLDSPVLKMKYLELNGFHENVIEAHIESHNYEGALELVLRSGLYQRGIQIARKCKNEKEEVKFLILEVYAKLSLGETNPNAFKDLVEKVTTLKKETNDSSVEVMLAQIYLLKGLVFKDADECLTAMNLFNKNSITGGFLEAVNILLTVCNGVDTIWPEDILEYCLKATRLAQVFVKDVNSLSVHESSEKFSYMKLNQMQKCLNGEILVPPNQAYWLPSIRNKSSLKLKEVQTVLMFHEHLFGYCRHWLKQTNAINEVLSLFDLHAKVIRKDIISRKDNRRFNTYLKRLSIIVELNKAISCFPESQKILCSLFSPLSVLHNHAWRRYHLVSLQSLTSIIDSFKAEYEAILTRQRYHFTSLDQCMELWRLSLIVYGDTASLHHSIRGARPPNEFLSSGYRRRQHVFLGWVSAAFLLSYNCRVTRFLSMTYYDLILPISQSPTLFQSISDENLLYILILQSLSSIFLISLTWAKRLFVPKIFEYVMTNFNALNQQNQSCYSIMAACVQETQDSYDLSQLGRIAVRRLEKLLEFLLQNKCHILSRVIQNANNTMTKYYFMLVLMISANLLVARPTLDNKHLYRNFSLFVMKLGSILTSTSKPYFADGVYYKVIRSRNVYDLFNIIREQLENSEIQQIYPNSRSTYLYSETMGMRPDDVYPNIELRQSLFPTEDVLQEVQLQEEQLPQEIEEDEEEDEIEAPIEYEQEVPVEQTDLLMNKLKEHMIENHVCKLCNIEIPIDEEMKPEFLSPEQRDNVENNFDKHIASREHRQKKNEHYEYMHTKEEFEIQERNTLVKLKKCQNSSQLSPEDDEKLTQIEHQISIIHSSIETTSSNEDSWIKMTKRIKQGIKALNELYQDLNDQKEGSQFFESDDNKEHLVSPDVEMQALNLDINLLDNGTKRKVKKLK